jgi:hypothetical protein
MEQAVDHAFMNILTLIGSIWAINRLGDHAWNGIFSKPQDVIAQTQAKSLALRRKEA